MTPSQQDPRPIECQEFASALQRLLDREMPVESLSRSHAFECPDCRALLAAVDSLRLGLDQLPPLMPPPGLDIRITSAALRDFRRRRMTRWAGAGAAVAAALLAAILYFAPGQFEEPQRELVQTEPTSRAVDPAPPGRVSDRFAEAGSALASITQKASNQALSPTRSLVTSPESVMFAPAELPTGMEPAADSLAGMPDAARSGLEPVTSSARRAVNLFLRDTGLAKPKS